jgi:hypothetical protein
MHRTSITPPSAASQATMRALVVAGPGRVRVDDAPLPAPGEGEVRIRLEGSGVCGSSLPVWSGRPWFSYPLEPGARATRAGAGSTPWSRTSSDPGWANGSRVGTLAHAPTPWCRRRRDRDAARRSSTACPSRASRSAAP